MNRFSSGQDGAEVVYTFMKGHLFINCFTYVNRFKKGATVIAIAALAVVSGVQIGRAALTLDSASVSSDGTLSLSGAAASAITIGAAAQTGTVDVASSTGAMVLDLGTGTGAHTINIGGSAGTVAVNSSNWNVSSAGAVSGVTSFSVNGGSALARYITATGTIDFASTASSTCATSTITVTGAQTGDTVQLGAPATVENGIVWSGYVSATNTVTVRECNVTTSTIDPASASWRASVLK
jgi:hypothetical protein